MKHFIIVKFKKGYNYVEEIDNIKALFERALDIPEIKTINIHKSSSDKENRHDLMIEMLLSEKGLLDFDNSIIHNQWKEIYGNYIENKTIFDCE